MNLESLNSPPRIRPAARWLLAALAAVPACSALAPRPSAPLTPAEVDDTLRSLQTTYGPSPDRGDLRRRVAGSVRGDLNDDGQEETLVFIAGEGSAPIAVRRADDLRDGTAVAGFALVTRMNGSPWPVFYYYDEAGVALGWRDLDRRRGLLGRPTGSDTHILWGWEDFSPDLRPRWTALSCRWSEPEKRFLDWAPFPPLRGSAQ